MPISTRDLDLYEKKAPEEFDSSPSMPLIQHLEELRSKVLISFLSFVVACLIGFYSSKEVIALITNIAPSGTEFFQIKPGEFFFTSLRVSFYIGFALALPVILWQLSSFILPGLKEKERLAVLPVLVASPILFLVGSVFAYYFVAPSMLNFLFGFGKDVIASSISIEAFVSFSLMVMAVCGFSFLLPVVLVVLARLRIINSRFLLSQWRYAVLGSAIAGAVLTPTPDPFNMFLVSGILVALYFISALIIKTLRL